MPSLKARIAPALHRLAWALGLSTFRARAQPVMRILMLHGIGADDYPEETFTAQAEWLARRFSVVPLDVIARKAAEGKSTPSREIALTFDDGLKGHATVVYPILKRLGLPATFFLCPGLIASGRWLWTHEMRARLETLGRDCIDALVREVVCGPVALASVTVGRHMAGAHATTAVVGSEAMISRMKELPSETRAAAEERVREATPEFTPGGSEGERYDVMTWDDAAGLDPALITIGSHTSTHPILPTLDGAQQEEEIAGSRRLLEERLGRTVDLFCYPNGSRDAKVEASVRRHYRAAVTTHPGFVRPGDDLHTFARIAAPASSPLLAWRLHRPGA